VTTERQQAEDEGFAIFPRTWIRRIKTFREGKVLLSIISHAERRTGEAYPSIATIANETGIPRNHVSETLPKLCAAGFLEKIDRPYRSSVYRLVGWTSPKLGAISPKLGAISPKLGAISPESGAILSQVGDSNRPTGQTTNDDVPQNGKEEPKASNDLLAAIAPFCIAEGKDPNEEAESALRTVGYHKQSDLIAQLRAPVTKTKRRPIGYAIKAAREGYDLTPAPTPIDSPQPTSSGSFSWRCKGGCNKRVPVDGAVARERWNLRHEDFKCDECQAAEPDAAHAM